MGPAVATFELRWPFDRVSVLNKIFAVFLLAITHIIDKDPFLCHLCSSPYRKNIYSN